GRRADFQSAAGYQPALHWDLLSEISWKRWTLLFASAVALFFLYFFGLTRAGMLGPDEPRYAAIGAAMAQSGDWVTPRLWGIRWFEKPALLYWMTATAFKAGLDEDLAPRLPVAILSAGFLIFFFFALRREFGERAAWYSTAILATSAGWLAYSHSAVPDLPVSATFAAAMLSVMPRRATATDVFPSRDRRQQASSMDGLVRGQAEVLRVPLAKGAVLSAGILLGLAVLAKGLVPLALFLPAVWFLRRRLRDLCLLLAATAAIATPWYALVILRNGQPFIDEFFWTQHFGRLASHALMHERPFWFYAPVLLTGFFPWIPLFALLFVKRTDKDQRVVFLLVWVAWGLIFFSVFLNKLPGYVLPLFPAIAALLGIALAQTEQKTTKMVWLLGTCGALFWIVPAIQSVLPRALQSGMSRASIQLPIAWIFPALALGIVCALLERSGRRDACVAMIALVAIASVVALILKVCPILDATVSARGTWKSSVSPITCVTDPNRSRLYGLNYYAGTDLPDCK
ncbi:MAG TPA: glycosyltransferase family 39 protein, partial [Bryobacteraceae bacterium]